MDDYAGNSGTTGEIAAGQSRNGKIEIQFDHDWFRISLSEGETYEVNLRGKEAEPGRLPDPYLILLDADGNYIAANDDANGTLNSQIVHTADATGDYFIDAAGPSAYRTYELSVAVDRAVRHREPGLDGNDIPGRLGQDRADARPQRGL